MRKANRKRPMGERAKPAENSTKSAERKTVDRRALAILALALIIAIAYAAKFYVGVSAAGDDVAYSNYAHFVLNGGFRQSSGDSLSIRIMQYYPVAFFYLISNNSYYAGGAWDIFAYVATVVIVFFIGKELYNEFAGAVASLILALFPTVMIFSTTMSDNPPVMFFAALAMLFLLYGTRKRRASWYAMSGASVIAAIAVMPLGLMALAISVFYIIVEYLRKKLDRNVLMFFAGLLIGLAILSSFNYVNAGKPFITFTETFNYFQNIGGPNHISPANNYLLFYFDTMFPYHMTNALYHEVSSGNQNTTSIWAMIFAPNYNVVGFYFYVAVFAMLYMLYKREKRAYFAFFWFAVGFLLMEFDPVHFTILPFTYILQHRLDRYLTFIEPPVALLMSMAMVRFVESARKANARNVRMLIVGAIMLFLFLTEIPVVSLSHNILSLEGRYELNTAKYLETLPNTTEIYVINNVGGFLPTYMKFDNFSRFSSPGTVNCSQLDPNSYVVVQTVSQYNADTCPSWQLVYYTVANTTFKQDVTGPATPFELNVYHNG